VGMNSKVKGYAYIKNNTDKDIIPIMPDNIKHIKLPNPLDTYEGLGLGLSPLASIAKSVDVDNAITDYLNLFFQQGSMVTGILSYDTPLDESTMARVRNNWEETYGGIDNWGVGVLDSGGNYQRVGLTFEEMSFNNQDTRNETRILSPFGVPPILIGTKVGLERSTYSNYQQARQAFWEDTFVPENIMFEVEYQSALNSGNEFVEFDYSLVPALKKNIKDLTLAWSALVDRGVSKEDAAKTVGLKLSLTPGSETEVQPRGNPTDVSESPTTPNNTNEGGTNGK